jgi:uncharacterized RDD family membrane protein YckC
VSGIDALMKEPSVQSYWARRLFAFVVDAIMVSIVVGVFAFLFALGFFLALGPAAIWAILAGAFSFSVGILLVVYSTLAETYAGATLGKQIFGLKVTTSRGGRPAAGEAALRNISKIYWLLLLLDVVIGLATSKKHTQKFSDQYAGTEVVEATGTAGPG